MQHKIKLRKWQIFNLGSDSDDGENIEVAEMKIDYCNLTCLILSAYIDGIVRSSSFLKYK